MKRIEDMTSQEAADILAVMMKKLEGVIGDFESQQDKLKKDMSTESLNKIRSDMYQQMAALFHGYACLQHAIKEGTIIPLPLQERPANETN